MIVGGAKGGYSMNLASAQRGYWRSDGIMGSRVVRYMNM
jgi:hypothetical protein